jgi:hypothetical protein
MSEHSHYHDLEERLHFGNGKDLRYQLDKTEGNVLDLSDRVNRFPKS